MSARSVAGQGGMVAAAPGADARATGTVRIALLCTDAWSVRNVVLAGTVEELTRLGIDVAVVAPPTMATGCASAPLVRPARVRVMRGKSLFDALFAASFARHFGLRSHRIFDRWRQAGQPAFRRGLRALVGAVSVLGGTRSALEWQRRQAERMTRRCWDIGPVREQLKALQPDLLITTSSVVWDEQPYVLAARDLKIPVLGCILSFDNLTSRGALPEYDDYLVWNERMRDQVLRIYGARAIGRVTITGSPQFDFHVREAYRIPRAALLSDLGLPLEARFVLYAANAAQFTPTEPSLVRAFANRCATTPSLADHWIIVRLHPLDDWGRWQDVIGACDRVRISVPWSRDAMSADDQRLLVGSVREADVCINMASTMSLDAAAVDTPVVCVGFALPPGSAEDQFCSDVYSTDHFAPIIESAGVRLARSLDELVGLAAGYAASPDQDRDARRRLVQTEIGVVDGAAAGRVAAAIAGIARAAASRGGRGKTAAP